MRVFVVSLLYVLLALFIVLFNPPPRCSSLHTAYLPLVFLQEELEYLSVSLDSPLPPTLLRFYKRTSLPSITPELVLRVTILLSRSPPRAIFFFLPALSDTSIVPC